MKDKDEENKRKSKIATDKLMRALVAGIGELTQSNAFIVMTLLNLKDLLTALEKNKKKFKKENNFEIKKLNERLKYFEGFIDKKFWNEDALMYLIMALSCGVTKTLDEALKLCEEFYSL